MSHQEYVRFLTEQFVTKMNETENEKQERKEKRQQPLFTSHWLGLFPFTWKILMKK